ncbi:MAG: hypothetical protein WDW38_009580 [Sanguina aurantia]
MLEDQTERVRHRNPSPANAPAAATPQRASSADQSSRGTPSSQHQHQHRRSAQQPPPQQQQQQQQQRVNVDLLALVADLAPMELDMLRQRRALAPQPPQPGDPHPAAGTSRAAPLGRPAADSVHQARSLLRPALPHAADPHDAPGDGPLCHRGAALNGQVAFSEAGQQQLLQQLLQQQRLERRVAQVQGAPVRSTSVPHVARGDDVRRDPHIFPNPVAVRQEAADARHASLQLFEEKLRRQQERERRTQEAAATARKAALLADTAADSAGSRQAQAALEPAAVPLGLAPPAAAVRVRRNSGGNARVVTGPGAVVVEFKEPRQPHEYVKPWRAHMADPAAGLGPLDLSKLTAAAAAAGGTSLAIEVRPPAYSSQAGPQPTGRAPSLDPEAHEALKEYMQRKQAEQAARARSERIQAGAAVQQRVQTAREEADKARERDRCPATRPQVVEATREEKPVFSHPPTRPQVVEATCRALTHTAARRHAEESAARPLSANRIKPRPAWEDPPLPFDQGQGQGQGQEGGSSLGGPQLGCQSQGSQFEDTSSLGRAGAAPAARGAKQQLGRGRQQPDLDVVGEGGGGGTRRCRSSRVPAACRTGA